MLTKINLFIFGVAAAVVTAGALLVANDLNRAALFDSSGFLISGERFGIKVGDNFASVKYRLESMGLDMRGEGSRPGRCGAYEVKSDKIYYFYDFSWRRGVVCIGINADRVDTLSWYFNPLSP
ncbi:hypothetical protein [Rhizorhabdus sp. FW153]|uniref:hypothetical protein n=1 Tax=Rhizorhabdus sp. FW153 TaxID=3400216 RepID=UPI003CF4B600